jgi:hypothetical protein
MLHRRISPDGVVYYASPVLEAAGVPHAFSTRIGGVSAAPFDSLNLGNPNGYDLRDPDENLAENYRRLFVAAGCAGREWCRVHQVHGATIAGARRGEPFDRHQKADAIVGDDPERALTVRVADCVPVLLATADGRAVAAVHAGWRGVVAGVVPAAAAAVRAVRAEAMNVLAAIGPSIGASAFEVGPEVLVAFAGLFGGAAIVERRPDGKGLVDLRRAIHLQLREAGLADEQIDSTDRCTYRDADEFFSHRRDRGLTGRMAAVISPGERQVIAVP